MISTVRVRVFVVGVSRAAFALLVSLFAVSPAAAQGALFGQESVPESIKPLMQKPFGISFLQTNVGETLKVSDLGLVLGGQPVPPGLVSLGTVTHSTSITGVLADVWLLPFVNVHGAIGHMSGTASDITPTVVPGLLPPGVTIPSSQDYSGTAYIGGVTLAIGYKRMFASYDFSYTHTSVDLLSDDVSAVTQGIRAGVKLGSGKYRATLYGGAFHESIGGPLTGTGLIPGLNPDFTLTVTPKNPWNAIAGVSLELTPRFVVTVEGGFGDRMQFALLPGIRF